MDNHDDLPLFAAPPVRPAARERPVISVSELNRRTKSLLEGHWELLWVGGELSNVVRASSGHWYFSLKDNNAQVRCVMFKNRAGALGFTPENGMQVEVRALPSLYEPRGDFQLGVENMRRAGLGALFEAYERLKKKLAGEGLFDDARQKALPFLPRAVGVVTSLQAAALRDVLTTLKRRAPMVNVVLYPTAVQGAGAAQEIAAAIDSARIRAEVDTLIVCRGGGSIEDLWSFNEEIVARAIVRLQNETAIPVISGVGHETDFTICDFVADRRAPTPTAAAELASPDREELLEWTEQRRLRLKRNLRVRLDTAQQRLDHAARGLLSPAARLARERDRLALLAARARHTLSALREDAVYRLSFARQRVAQYRPRTETLAATLDQQSARLRDLLARSMRERMATLDQRRRALTLLSPDQVLQRGYSIVEKDGVVLRDAAQASPGDKISVRLAKGSVEADITANKRST